MDDIASKITELLNDPEGMKKISSIASGLMQSGGSEENKEKEASPLNMDMPFDPQSMGNIMKIMSVLKNQNFEDDNSRLLKALKPHLSIERQKKVDKALSLLKIVKLLPVFKETGMFNLLGG